MDLSKEEQILADLKQKIKDQEFKIKNYDILSPKINEQELAEALHKKQCHSNHIDGCGWYYEKWDNIGKGSTKQTYLDKAKDILKDFTFEQAMNFVKKL